MAATTCLPNKTLDVAAPCAAKSQKNCVAPVWWPERRAQNPIPSRTRPLNTPAPMVLCLKTRESRSPPDPHNAVHQHSLTTITDPAPGHRARLSEPAHPDQPHTLGAGWSSPVARQAHNLKVTGSNPVPATKSRHTDPAAPPSAAGSAFVRTRTGPERLIRFAVGPLPDSPSLAAQVRSPTGSLRLSSRP